MKTYVVGGAVRDRLLGLDVHDRDFVVVGSSPEEMSAAGFAPVGRDFPVFLHPQSHEEYALARTERKSGPGYAGFTFHSDPSVTLEEDLARRDLTINAMAEDEHGTVIDLYGGQDDLGARVLRHVSPAFVEDPVRILRVARFAARFADFSIAPETLSLMRAMVESGEVDAPVAERVWQECSRGLCEDHPQRMLQVLDECGAMARISPPLAQRNRCWPVLEGAARAKAHLAVRFAVWMAEARVATADLDEIQGQLKAPQACRELARLVLREHPAVPSAMDSDEAILEVLERTDALRRPERFEEFLMTLALLCQTDRCGYAPARRLTRALQVIRAVDAGAVARSVGAGDIRAAVRAARLAALVALRTSESA